MRIFVTKFNTQFILRGKKNPVKCNSFNLYQITSENCCICLVVEDVNLQINGSLNFLKSTPQEASLINTHKITANCLLSRESSECYVSKWPASISTNYGFEHFDYTKNDSYLICNWSNEKNDNNALTAKLLSLKMGLLRMKVHQICD